MTLNQSIAKNSLVQLVGKLASLVLGLISVAVMTRYLGLENFGYYTTAIAFLQFFGIIVDFGLSLTTVQMISKPGADVSKTMNAIMTLRVISALIFLTLAPIVILFFPYDPLIKLGVLITVESFFAATLIQTMSGVFQKNLKMTEVTIAEVAGRLVLVGGIVAAALLHGSILWVFAFISIASTVNLAVLWKFSRKYVDWRWQTDKAVWKEVWRRTWPIAISITFNLIYLKTDTIILSLVRSQSEVGLYGATYRVIDILTMLPAVYMGIILPLASNYFQANNFIELKKILQRAFDALMIFAVPIVVGTYLIARPLMVFIAGSAFAPSGDILKVLIWASAAIFGTSLWGYALIAVEKQRTMTWAYGTAAFLTFAGYLYFIPKFGYWGAAWMTVFSEVLIMIWSAIVLHRAIKFFPSLKIFLKAIPAALIMAAALYFLPQWHVFFQLLISGMIYFPLLYLFGGFEKETVMAIVRRTNG